MPRLILMLLIALTFTALLSLTLACSTGEVRSNNCDTLKAKEAIFEKSFNRLPEYDTQSFTSDDFYDLDSSTNKMLWYRDIENIDTTKFTTLWNAYHPANYLASNADFIQHYQGRKGIELAFQFGPNEDLWAYHTFVVKQVRCCYLITRSYFRHGRFTYKAFAMLEKSKLDSLNAILKETNPSDLSEIKNFGYAGFFVDNGNKKTFYIDFKKETIRKPGSEESRDPKPEIQELYNFIDKRISWTITYE